MRASEKTWIRYIPVTETSKTRFSFSAEGYRTLETVLAYYDWLPAHDGDLTLKRIYQRVNLSPDGRRLFPDCEAYAAIAPGYERICHVSVYHENITRALYFRAASGWAQEQALETGSPKGQETARNAPVAGAAADVEGQPFPTQLNGTITLVSDTDNTRVTYQDEPLVRIQQDGRITQVRLSAAKPQRFDYYGKDLVFDISKRHVFRFDAEGLPSYYVELLPNQWRCSVMSLEEAKGVRVPPFLNELVAAPLVQHLCHYNVTLDVRFKDIARQIAENAVKGEKAEDANKDAGVRKGAK